MSGDDVLALASVDEPELTALARALAPALACGGIVHLVGDLGAGKTTFARALLQALGVGDRVKSPTYSLIESYTAGQLDIHHLDLYRIADPGELEWLGLEDLWKAGSLVLVEWPERGRGALPEPDVTIELAHAGPARSLRARAQGPRGAAMVAALRSHAAS